MKYAKYLLILLLSLPVGYTFCGSVGDLGGAIVNKNDVEYCDISKFYPEVGSNVYVACKSTVREKPSTSSKKVKTLEAGTGVTILGYIDDWAIIPSGYIYAGLLSSEYDEKFDITSSDMESRKYIGYIHTKLASLSGKLLEVAEKTPIKLVMSAEELEVDTPGVDPAGVTDKWKGTDLVDIIIKCNTGPMFKNLVHEFGHVIDYKNMKTDELYSSSDEFVSIYENEVDSFRKVYTTSKHNTSDSREYFAELVKWYNEDKGKLKESVPKSFEYIDSILGGK